jgi:pyridoxamine 5'-phosphate oxidase-like protein
MSVNRNVTVPVGRDVIYLRFSRNKGGPRQCPGAVNGQNEDMPIAEKPYMPEYGVGGNDWRPLPWSWAAERLAAYRSFWVVTSSLAARPHAMPVWGVWDDRTFRFGFSCGQLTRKAYNIRANPQVVVTGADVVEAISIEGIASEVTDGASLENWVAQYIAKYGTEAPEADFFRQYAFFEVAAEIAFGVIEREPEFSTRATRWRFSEEISD